MATAVRRRKKRLILDIGSSAVRMCELSKVKNGYQLTKYRQLDFNADPALSDDERKENRIRTIQRLLKETKVRTKKTIFGVPGQSVFTRTRPLPPVPEYKVSQIVRYEIQQQIPFSLDQIAMDYQILDRTSAGGYEVMMAAIKVDVVDKQVDLLHAAKRGIDTVDVSPLAAYNWLKKTGAFGSGSDCVAMIDLGATTTDIVIEREGQFRFTRPLNVGGNDITKGVAAAFGLNFSDAERSKRERGFAPTGDPAKDGKAGEVIGQTLQRLVSEIMRSFAFFRSQPGGGQVNRVVLCGGGARMRNIVPYLQNRLGVEVKIVDPLGGIQVGAAAKSVGESPEQACVVLGLALRCIEPVPIEINLIPPRILEAIRIKEQAFYWILILMTLGLIFASVIPVKAKQNELDLARIDVLRQHINEYDSAAAAGSGPPVPSPKVSTFSTLKNQVNNLKSHIEALDSARLDRRFWLDELKLVSDARPADGTLVITAFESAIVKDGGSPAAAAPAAPAASPYGGGNYGGGGYGGGGGRGGGYGGGAMGNSMVNSAGAISTGFPGVDGLFSAGGIGGTPGMGGGMGGGLGGRGGGEGDYGYGGGMGGGMGGMPGMGGASRYNARVSTELLPDVKLEEPNGLNINGLADSDTAIQAFVANLEKATLPLYNRKLLRVKKVYFAEASVQRLGPNAIYNATAAMTGGRGGGVGMRGDGWFSFQINLELETLTREQLAATNAAPTPEGTPVQ